MSMFDFLQKLEENFNQSKTLIVNLKSCNLATYRESWCEQQMPFRYLFVWSRYHLTLDICSPQLRMNISQCKNIKYLMFVGSQVEECSLGTSDTAITVGQQLFS